MTEDNHQTAEQFEFEWDKATDMPVFPPGYKPGSLADFMKPNPFIPTWLKKQFDPKRSFALELLFFVITMVFTLIVGLIFMFLLSFITNSTWLQAGPGLVLCVVFAGDFRGRMTSAIGRRGNYNPLS